MDVKVKIKTSQRRDDGEVQTIESFYKGNKQEKNGSLFINFLEYDTVKDSLSTIKINPEYVLILKSGEIRTKMRFKEGETYTSRYSTPYGDFKMDIYTYKIAKKITNTDIKVNLDYRIDIEGLLSANNRIEIKVVPEA